MHIAIVIFHIDGEFYYWEGRGETPDDALRAAIVKHDDGRDEECQLGNPANLMNLMEDASIGYDYYATQI